ncbi:MAG: sulfite exporter TauE/SafE family protein [Gemmatimonadota bacterium]|nr:MAG: sulfite exporter TauE/SafE family protein [Gemmatimonadota bacterium]
MSVFDFVITTLIVTIGALLQGSIGIGLGMFAAPMLLLIDPAYIPGPLLFSALVLTVLLTHRDRHAIQVSDLGWALSGRLVGIVGGMSVLVLCSPDRLRAVFGIIILAAVALSASGFHMRPRPSTLVLAGALSGLMGTTVSVGGPAMALVYQYSAGPRIRGTLSAYFVAGVSVSLVGLHFVGFFGAEQLVLAVSFLPGIMVGYLLSRHIASVLDKGYTRVAVLSVSAAAGALALLKQVL